MAERWVAVWAGARENAARWDVVEAGGPHSLSGEPCSREAAKNAKGKKQEMYGLARIHTLTLRLRGFASSREHRSLANDTNSCLRDSPTTSEQSRFQTSPRARGANTSKSKLRVTLRMSVSPRGR